MFYVQLVIAGVATGAIYSLAGVGVVLTYKGTGVFNFAHGAIAMIVAYAFWDGGRIGTWARLALAIEAESPRRRRPRARVGQRASRAGRSVGERLER